jgi:inositol polyphosphate-4-phosphatase
VQIYFIDIAEVPICEISLACDNLLCDGHGCPPNPSLVVDVYMPTAKLWVQYGRTEIIEVGTVFSLHYFYYIISF